MKRWAAVILAATTCSSAGAAVFEVGADGSMERLDVAPVSALPAPVPRRTAPRTAARAAAFQPFVQQAATRYELSPALIDAIARTESRYDQDAVSVAGAGGVMQLMPGTARDLGVDRRDPAANIRGGAAYLRMLLNRFDGDVVCTIAAYNAGPAAVSKARCVPPYRETIAYVAAVLERLSAAAR